MPTEQPSPFPRAPRRGASSRAVLRRSVDLHLSAPTVRWGLIAVATGAVIAAMVTLFLTGFDSKKNLEAHPPGAPVQTMLDKELSAAAMGDCLSWSKPDRSDLFEVNCSNEHKFEVAAEIDLSRYPGKEFGPGSRAPDVLRATELKEEHCVPAVQKYLGGRFDPQGKYLVQLMYPSQEAWKHGDRTLHCGLQGATKTGTTPLTTGSATEQDQSKVYEPGVCLGINQNLPTDPVDCAQPHAVEIVSTIDLGTRFDSTPPPKEEQDKFMNEECTRTAPDYLGGPDVIRDKTLTMFFDYIDARSWMAGSHKLNCMIGKGTDREGFAPIVGSAKGDILINGQAPIPPPKNGRSTPAPLPGAAPLPPQPEPRPR
ncbi:septum formation family protein [Nocardia sp. 004]|uniref:septum formation family protein n=1 Tax=Nocardia sp. 004 TaxID=3385978 RepID=UPI0039A237F7